MREIIFRGKRVEIGAFAAKAVCEWVYGGYTKDCCSEYIYSTMHNPRMVHIDPSTVGQYTGLTDIAGTKAFEHDCILEPSENAVGVIRYGKYQNPFNDGVRACHIGFYVDWISGEYKEILRKDLGYWLNILKIIGNIHDNPELLPM